ncbi:MAG: hypothetical protein PVJ44_06740 [Desulfobacterales bacterium]
MKVYTSNHDKNVIDHSGSKTAGCVNFPKDNTETGYGKRSIATWMLLLILFTSCDPDHTPGGEILFITAWEGIQSGLLWVGSSIAHLVLHPLLSVQGVEHAVQHWDDVADALVSEWDYYRQAARLDSAVFVKSTLILVTALSLSVLVTRVLEKFASRLSSPAQRKAMDLSDSVMRGLSKIGRRNNAVLHQAVVFVRARNVLLTRRHGAHLKGMRRIRWRIRNGYNDVIQILYMAFTQPFPCLVYAIVRLSRLLVLMLKSVLSATMRQLVLLALPVAIFFQPWISDTIRLQAMVTSGHQHIAPMVRQYRSDVEQLSLADLKIRTRQLQSAYQEYRLQFLILVQEADRIAKEQVGQLDKLVEENALTDQVIDTRLWFYTERFVMRKMYLAKEIFWYHMDAAHSPQAPSRNWLVSYEDEMNLFREAQQHVGAEDKAKFLHQIITGLENTILYELCIARWDVTELLDRPLPPKHQRCGSANESK